MEQARIWEEHAQGISEESIIKGVHNPAVFQRELADFLNQHLGGKGAVIEVGCEQGITTFLLECEKKVFLT